jgi:hypothetical protein
MHESAGKQTPASKRHGNKWLAAMLVEAAGSVGRMHGKNYLAAQHARLMKRRGMGRAQIAVAHTILVSPAGAEPPCKSRVVTVPQAPLNGHYRPLNGWFVTRECWLTVSSTSTQSSQSFSRRAAEALLP